MPETDPKNRGNNVGRQTDGSINGALDEYLWRRNEGDYFRPGVRKVKYRLHFVQIFASKRAGDKGEQK